MLLTVVGLLATTVTYLPSTSNIAACVEVQFKSLTIAFSLMLLHASPGNSATDTLMLTSSYLSFSQ